MKGDQTGGRLAGSNSGLDGAANVVVFKRVTLADEPADLGRLFAEDALEVGSPFPKRTTGLGFFEFCGFRARPRDGRNLRRLRSGGDYLLNKN